MDAVSYETQRVVVTVVYPVGMYDDVPKVIRELVNDPETGLRSDGVKVYVAKLPTRWVIQHIDNGVDGMQPERIYGIDIGPFDTKAAAEAALDELRIADTRPYAPHLRVKEVSHPVVRWE